MELLFLFKNTVGDNFNSVFQECESSWNSFFPLFRVLKWNLLIWQEAEEEEWKQLNLKKSVPTTKIPISKIAKKT